MLIQLVLLSTFVHASVCPGGQAINYGNELEDIHIIASNFVSRREELLGTGNITMAALFDDTMTRICNTILALF
jgi:hypothetical protein